MKSSVTVWKKDIDCNGVIYHTSITKPTNYAKWQIALHVKVEGANLHDYSTHFVKGAGVYDSQILQEQVMCMFGRLLHKLPELNEAHHVWYNKMLFEYFKVAYFDFEI